MPSLRILRHRIHIVRAGRIRADPTSNSATFRLWHRARYADDYGAISLCKIPIEVMRCGAPATILLTSAKWSRRAG